MTPATSRLLVSFALAAALAAVALAAPQAYNLPADSDTLLGGEPIEAFTCENQPYGYYADVDNGCQIFHICLPIEDDAGEIIETAQWSFLCGNGTIFDQQTLTCNFPDDAFPCEEAPSLYGNVEYGRIEERK